MQPLFTSKARAAFTFAAVLLCVPHTALADTINISGTAVTPTEMAPSSDTFSLNAGSGTFDSNAGVFILQTGDFVIGNSNIPDQVIPFSFQDTITLNGVTQTVTIAGQDDVTDVADTFSILGGTPINFGGETLTLQPFTVTGDAIDEDLPVDLEATVTPEPGTLFLLGTGMLCGVGLMTSKRCSWVKPSQRGL